MKPSPNLEGLRAGSMPVPPSAAMIAAFKKKNDLEKQKKAHAGEAEDQITKSESSNSLLSSDDKTQKSDKGYGFEKIDIPRTQGRQFGKLKFFDEKKKFGFLLPDGEK